MMSNQSQGASISLTADPPVKRRRGRPRKDDSIQGDITPLTPATENLKNKQSVGTSDPTSNEIVGQMVSGVIEGSFDAGYLLNVKVCDTDMHLRGVAFLPGRFTPITAENDVAPHAKMYERNDIPIPLVNAQGHLHTVSPSSGKNEKPVEDKNDAPNLPGQGLQIGLFSGAMAASKSQSASISIPLASNLPINDTGLPLGQKVLQDRILDSGLQTDKAMVQDQSPLGFEALKLMKGPNISVEALNTSEPVPAMFTADVPAAKTVNPNPQVDDQAVCSDLKSQELFHDDVKILDTPKTSEPEAQADGGEPTQINLFKNQASSRQDIDISQDTELELATKIIGGVGTSHMDGLSSNEAATTATTGSCSESMTSQPVTIFGVETIPSEPKPAAEETVPEMVVPEDSSSSLMAADTNCVESNAKDAIPPAQS
ncbi:uncharacterized protein LOC105768333 [Gossypium raimondii]|uniref:AT hook motif-containing protein n=1 Tax=Gossypium raimondii TaxID=29730 RepID=A0A0D2UP50_GOSRA|nr:uncharacterized protein LOC105768333 [Gossypium raimondii]KJB57725.1 hypothetical protein B456_009G177800 [Gossypium raimondii]MBA0595238.1 hypothetical protein [Gossypium raimondii]